MKIIRTGNSIKNIISTSNLQYDEYKSDSCYSCPDMGCVCEDENNN